MTDQFGPTHHPEFVKTYRELMLRGNAMRLGHHVIFKGEDVFDHEIDFQVYMDEARDLYPDVDCDGQQLWALMRMVEAAQRFHDLWESNMTMDMTALPPEKIPGQLNRILDYALKHWTPNMTSTQTVLVQSIVTFAKRTLRDYALQDAAFVRGLGVSLN